MNYRIEFKDKVEADKVYHGSRRSFALRGVDYTEGIRRSDPKTLAVSERFIDEVKRVIGSHNARHKLTKLEKD